MRKSNQNCRGERQESHVRYHGRSDRVRDRRDRRVSLVRLSELRLPVKEEKSVKSLSFVKIYRGRRTPCARVIIGIVVI
jgi:hypothetical protein